MSTASGTKSKLRASLRQEDAELAQRSRSARAPAAAAKVAPVVAEAAAPVVGAPAAAEVIAPVLPPP